MIMRVLMGRSCYVRMSEPKAHTFHARFFPDCATPFPPPRLPFLHIIIEHYTLKHVEIHTQSFQPNLLVFFL